jgi:hypothetical protein
VRARSAACLPIDQLLGRGVPSDVQVRTYRRQPAAAQRRRELYACRGPSRSWSRSLQVTAVSRDSEHARMHYKHMHARTAGESRL